MSSLKSRIYTYVISVWIALSVASIALGVIVWARLNQNFEASFTGARFKLALQESRALIQDAELSQRGYLLTGKESYIATFDQDAKQLPKKFEELAQLADGNLDLRNEILGLRADIELKLDEMQRTINARRKDGANAALKMVQVDDGQARLAKIRQSIAQLDRQPSDLMSLGSNPTRDELGRALAATLVAGVLSLGAGILALYLSRVTFRKELNERALGEQAVRAERAAQEKNAFLASMSHEIRTPMNAILGFSEMLVAELPPEGKFHQRAQAIRESALSLLQLINDILDLSKVEAGMLELHPEPTDLGEVSTFMHTVFAQQALRKGLQLDFGFVGDPPPALLLDRSRLRQILVNLIGNALKFTPKGSVTMRIAWNSNAENRSHGTLVIAVEDTGVGIPREKQEQIFHPFVQVDPLRPAEMQGSGLGLSIVRRITERMGGEITVESEIGRGSVFRLRLPDIAISTRLPAHARADTIESVNFDDLRAARILVVDDNKLNRDLIGSIFELTHHEISYASNGREAVECIHTQHPDVVLMDIRMPEMDGRTALQEIHRTPGTELLPVIAVTASSMVDDEHMLRQSFAGYVRKPFTRQMLFHELAAFLPRCPERSAAPRVAPEIHRPDTPSLFELWPDLVQSLRYLEAVTWPAIRSSGAVSDVKSFAHQLLSLAQSRGCPPLRHYADALSQDADDYALSRIEKHLSDFPTLIKSIAERAAPTAAA